LNRNPQRVKASFKILELFLINPCGSLLQGELIFLGFNKVEVYSLGETSVNEGEAHYQGEAGIDEGYARDQGKAVGMK